MFDDINLFFNESFLNFRINREKGKNNPDDLIFIYKKEQLRNIVNMQSTQSPATTRSKRLAMRTMSATSAVLWEEN